jgi:hypothetical protein
VRAFFYFPLCSEFKDSEVRAFFFFPLCSEFKDSEVSCTDIALYGEKSILEIHNVFRAWQRYILDIGIGY